MIFKMRLEWPCQKRIIFVWMFFSVCTTIRSKVKNDDKNNHIWIFRFGVWTNGYIVFCFFSKETNLSWYTEQFNLYYSICCFVRFFFLIFLQFSKFCEYFLHSFRHLIDSYLDIKPIKNLNRFCSQNVKTQV